MVETLIYLIVVMLVISIAWWLVDYIPVPAPMNKWAKIIIILVAAILLVNILLGLAGRPIFPMR
jgi:cytochrome c oxidase subunit IV